MAKVETERLAALHGYGVMDTLPEESFDRLTQLAAELFDSPIALVSLLDENRQWFKSRFGLNATETPRAWAFCEHAIALGPDATFVVEDASTDPRFAANPLVTDEPNIRFYAGATLTTPGGENLGTLCVIDTAPRARPSDRDLQRLTTLARVVVGELEMRRTAHAAAEKQRILSLAEVMSGVGHWRVDAANNQVAWSDEVYRIHGVTRASFNPNLNDAVGFYSPEDQEIVANFVARGLSHQEAYSFQLRLKRADGALRHVICKAECELGDRGETLAIVGVFQDVTEYVLALEAAEKARLKAEEEARRAAVAEQIAGLGHWRVDFPSRALTWSDQMYEIYGLARSTAIEPDAIMAMIHPDDLNLTQDRLNRDLAGEALEERPTIRIIRPDGAVRWVVGHTKVEKDEDGHVTALVGTLMDISRQNEAKLLIAESESRYRLLTENSQDLVIKMSCDAVLEYVSPSITALLGYEPAEMLGRSAEDLVYPADLESCRTTFARALSGLEVARDDYRLLRKDGSPIWVDARPRALRDTDTGEIVGVTDVIRDVTVRKAAETSLAESDARHRLLADNASDIITQADLGAQFTYVSPAIATVSGYKPEEVIGRSALDFVHPDDLDRMRSELPTALKNPAVQKLEYRHIRKDGRVIWVEAHPRFARDPKTGKPFAITDAIRDITERKAAEAALAESEARYRLLADNASDVITAIGPDAVLRYVSPSCRQFGYTAEELIGRTTLSLVHPEDLEFATDVVRRLFKGELVDRTVRREYRLRCKDGSYIWIEGNPTLILDDEGRPIEVLSVYRDVTERRTVEDKLAFAKAEAEAATAVKSEFLSNMSHELRTPLTSILGFSSLLEAEAGLTDQGRRAVERVNGSSQALLTIVNDILDFSKLESGQVEIDYRDVAPRKVLRDALELLEPQARAKGLSLEFKGDIALPAWVSMDDGRVRQILLNLLSNAVKFTAEGGATLAVRYDTMRERLRCEVIDTGAGIPPDRLDRLFKRFSQVDASTTRAFGGTGLGLAICKGLVEAMGGEIGVKSDEPGHGACFWFDLPCPVSARPEAVCDAADDRDDDALKGLRVLVADDNPVNRELVRILLTLSGVELTEVEDGEAAVARATEMPFDVILMDIRMPHLDGPSAARLIRQGGGPNDLTPILAFTANNAEDALTAETVGLFEGHVAKPISPSDLIWTLARWATPQPAVPIEQASHA